MSGLSSSVRAQEVKSVFSKHGKVVSAKIVTSAKSPGSKRFGFVTMNSAEEAQKCIDQLNKTELNGRIIQVERAKSDSACGTVSSGHHSRRDGPSGDRRRSDSSSAKRPDSDRRSQDGHRSKGSSRDRRPRVVDHRYGAPRPIRALGSRHSPGRDARPGATELPRHMPVARRLSPRRVTPTLRLSPPLGSRRSPRRPGKEPLGLSQIVEERERERLRAHERTLREEERRAREDMARQRMVERRQREEAERLVRERELLRAERERIERQRQDLLRLERENQRLERERLEREREELKRQQMKLAHTDRLPAKGSSRYDDPRGGRSLKRAAEDRPGRGADYYDDRKRPALDRGAPVEARGRYDPPPPPRNSRYDSTRDTQRHDSSSTAVPYSRDRPTNPVSRDAAVPVSGRYSRDRPDAVARDPVAIGSTSRYDRARADPVVRGDTVAVTSSRYDRSRADPVTTRDGSSSAAVGGSSSRYDRESRAEPVTRDSSSSSGARYDRDRADLPPRDTSTAGSRYESRHPAPLAPALLSGSATGKSSSTENYRWIAPAAPPSSSTSRRSDPYYDDRRSDSRATGSSSSVPVVASEGRLSRDYHSHGAPLVPPPAPMIGRTSDSSRAPRDSSGSGNKSSYGSSVDAGDVWRTSTSGTTSKSGYNGGGGGSSSKNPYSSSSSKSAYGSTTNGGGSLVAAQEHHHSDSGTWRGTVPSSSSTGRWPEGRGGLAASSNGGSSSTVRMTDFARGTITGSLSSSSHHTGLQSLPPAPQDTRGGYAMPSSSYRKY